MSKYVSLEEIQKFPLRFVYDEENADRHFINGLNTMIEYAECLEPVEIVRCKDCIHYGLNRLEEEYGCHCWTDWHFVWPHDFCSEGIKK